MPSEKYGIVKVVGVGVASLAAAVTLVSYLDDKVWEYDRIEGTVDVLEDMAAPDDVSKYIQITEDPEERIIYISVDSGSNLIEDGDRLSIKASRFFTNEYWGANARDIHRLPSKQKAELDRRDIR